MWHLREQTQLWIPFSTTETATTSKRPKGAEEAEYRAAGRASHKNAPFAAVEELNQVLGIDAELFEEMTPFVTAHSGKEGIDPVVARRRLIEILRRGDTPLPPSDTGLDFQLDDRTSDLPVYFDGSFDAKHFHCSLRCGDGRWRALCSRSDRRHQPVARKRRGWEPAWTRLSSVALATRPLRRGGRSNWNRSYRPT